MNIKLLEKHHNILNEFKRQCFNCDFRKDDIVYTSQNIIAEGRNNIVYNYHTDKVARLTKNIHYSNEYSSLLEEAINFLKMDALGIGPDIYEISFTKKRYFVVVMEKFDGDLKEINSEFNTIILSKKIMNIVKTLAKNDIVFFDIKPRNILYKKIGNLIILKLTDFDPHWFCNYKNLSNKVKKFMKMSGMHNNFDRYQFLINIMLTLFCLNPITIHLQNIYTKNWSIIEFQHISSMYNICPIFKIVFNNYFDYHHEYYMKVNGENNYKNIIISIAKNDIL